MTKFSFVFCLSGIVFSVGCTNCQCAKQERGSASVSDVQCEENEVAFFRSADYLKQVRREIEEAAKRGDLSLARTFLMTEALQANYRKKFGRSYQQDKLCNKLAVMCFFWVAVDTLPKIGTEEALDLLGHYYYGNVFEKEAELNSKQAESIIGQLLIGPYVEPQRRLAKGELSIEKIERETHQDVAETVVEVCHRDKGDVDYWRFRFHKYDINGRGLWIPTQWDLSGKR